MNAKTYPMNRKQTGFTLVELMITLLIAAILLSQAVPSFLTMLQNSRITTQANDYVTSLNVARSEAVKRGSRITVCKSTNNTTCIASGGWQQGWIIFVDADNDAVVDNGEEVLRAHGPFEPGNTLVGTGNTANYISFIGSGFSQLTNGGVQNGELVMCDNRGFGSNARAIILSASGAVRTVPADDATVVATLC